MKKKSIITKKIISMILFFISLILLFGFIITLNLDYLNWYYYSSPFYINVIVRSIEFLVPSILIMLIGIYLLRKNK